MAKADKSRFTQVMIVMIALVLLAILAVQVFPRRSSSGDDPAPSAGAQATSAADTLTVVHLPQTNPARATNNWVVAIFDSNPPAQTASPSATTNLQTHVQTRAGEHLAVYASTPELPTEAENVLLGTVRESSTGSGIRGRIVLRGTPPPPAQMSDVVCGGPDNKRTITSRQYRVGPEGGLADVLVYIKSGTGVDGKTFDPPEDVPVLDQVSCEYEPFVLGVMVGQRMLVRNGDPLLHNINFSRAKNNKGRNLVQAVQGMTSELVFEKKEVPILFKCDVHPWMTSYVAVFDNPHFTVTADDGRFHLPNVPPGNYQLVVYHRKTHGNTEGEIRHLIVTAAEPTELALTLDVESH
jgi:hypothetical protein